ncbi:MAG: Ig-like domain-containing protein [Clostridia bacterium]|nr:Ig-like domain-containing protein [Clostridia bacterium]
MKLKRFVAIVISLAMVLSIVPAFSLTASAAGTTGVIDALGGEVLWACPDGSFNDTAIGTAFSGWSSSITSGYVNVKTYSGVGNVIQYYVNGTENKTTITSPGYGDGTEEKLVIEWKMKRQNPSDLYFDFSFTDKSGTEIAFLKIDRNYTSVTDNYNMGFPAEGTDCAIVATNNGDGTHKVEYYVAGSVVYTIASKEGTVNGFGGIASSNGRWSTAWNHVGFGDLTIGAVYPAAETEVEVTVEYTADGAVVKTVNGRYDTAEGETGLALDAYTYYVNGGNYIYTADATTMSESGTIAMTKQANWNGIAVGDSVTYGGKKYSVTGTNLIPNGDFSQGTTGWFNGTGAAASFFTSNGDGTMTLSSGGTGQGGASSLYRAWKVEPNTTYVYTYTSTGGGQYHKNSLGASFNATGADGSNVILEGAAGTNTVVFTTGASENYLIASYRWLGSGEKFGNYGLYTVEEVIETTADTVKAGMDSLSLPLATKTSITVPTTSTDAYGYESTISWTSSNADVLAADGTVTAPSDITIVTLTPSTTYNGSTVTGDAHTVYVFPGSVAGTEYNSGSGYYDIGTENIISANGTDASFEDADGNQSLTGWLAHTGAQTNSAMNWGDATADVVPDGNWAYVGWWNDGITGTNYCTLDTMWEVEAGTYYLSFYAKKPAGGSTTYVYFSEDNAHHTAVDQITSEAWYELVSPGSDWAKYQYIITAETAGYIGFTSYNIGNNGSRGTWFDDFELYTAVQAAEDLVSVTNPADITVIAGNEPVLPKTVTGVGERGSAMTVDVTWNSADFANTTTSSKTVTVTGTAAGMSVSMNVIVLPETFAMDDVVAYAGQNTAAIHYFPIPVTGTATFEFDVVFNKLVNSTITLGDAEGNGGNCPIFGGTGDAISIQTNANGVNIRSWTDGSATSNVTHAVTTGETYRFLIVTDIDSDTWSAIMTDKNGVQTVVAEGHGYRKLVDQIDSITVLDNNSSADTINVSNIKVYAPAQASAITTYTFVANGSVSDTYTVKGTNAETIAIPHYDGHIMKTRTISGTTITATYEATTTSIGSWYMRNNFTDDNWISQSKYIGSHNAFADDDTLFVNDGGALYGDTGASSTGSTSRDNSRTQSVGVLDQLNAGVRYFDIRLSRQSDGTFATTHGPAFENFRDVAITMAQWAKENPGEVIILDFQTVRDALYDNETYTVITDNDPYYGPDEGDDNQYVYDALVQLFEDTGLADYMTTNWDRKYGALTSSGTVTAILPFGKGRAVNCQGGYFVNRSALNNDVTYTEESSYSDVVSYLDSTYSNLTDGATISTIHAYTTPFSLLIAGTPLLEAAQDNNPNWINEEGFYNWMGYGKGDVFMMNDSVSDIDLYYEALNKFNRTGSSYSYTENFIRTDDNVTINGAQANVPFSTKWTVEPTANTNTYTIDGKVYTAQTAYALDLMQFNTESVQPTGTVTVTFPMISDGATTVDALLSADGTTVYATAGIGEAISIETTALADVILATMVAPGKEYTVNYVADGTTIYTKTELVPYGQAVYSVPAGDFYLAATDKAYILNSAAADSHIAASTDTTTTFDVEVTIVSDNAVLTDTFANNEGSTDCNNTDNLLFVGSSGISDPGDADAAGDAVMANNGGNVGSPRIPVLMFNVPEVAEGKAVKLHLYVAKANQNLNNGGSMKLAANVADVTVDEAQGYVASSVANTTGVVWSDTMFTATGDAVSGRMPVDAWIEIDVTEFVAAATGSTITFTLYAPTAGAYVADREKAVAGGAYEGKAAYLEVVDANKVTVTGAALVTKSGKDVTTDAADGILVPVDSAIKARETGAELIAFTDGTNVYTTNSDGWATITPASDADYYAATLGVAMVDGAQVRIGEGVNDDGTVAGDSGLRFVTTVDKTDSLANVTGATFGVEVTAEGSSAAAVDIPADKWQVEGEVYTSALTNLAVSNYNRNFTATPYVSINGTKYYGSEVTRSIYQVASGLLATGYNGNYGESVDETGTNYTEMPEVLVKVLNGYVNQVGVRLIINEGVLAKSDKYTGSEDTFFTVSNASTNGSVYTCTLTAVGEAEINTDLFNTYVRINNNNSAVKTLVSVVDNGDGTYTLTFDGSSLVTE